MYSGGGISPGPGMGGYPSDYPPKQKKGNPGEGLPKVRNLVYTFVRLRRMFCSISEDGLVDP